MIYAEEQIWTHDVRICNRGVGLAIGLLFLVIGRPAILCIDRLPYSLSSDKAKRDFALGQLEQGHFEVMFAAGRLPKTCSLIC